jgi:hypothetical protein
MPPPSRFSHPHRRRGAPVSYFLLPHARRVASPPWVLDRRRLRHLHRCGVTAGHTATCARRAVIAPTCAAPSRATQAEADPASAAARCTHGPRQRRGRGPRTRYARGPSRCRERGPRATVQLGQARIRPSDTRFSFSNFRIYSNSCKFKNLCRILLNSENYETNFVGKVLICTRF